MGRENWGKLDKVVAMIKAARASGVRITADMYLYTAGGTSLDAALPPWVHDVFVNGKLALKDGEPTGASTGRVVRGRAWTGGSGGGCRASSRDWRR